MKIFVLCTVTTGLHAVEAVHAEIGLAGWIGLADRDAGDTISGFAHMAAPARGLGVPFYQVESYGLDSARDRELLLGLDIDLLLVLGWQRLVPGWLIDHCRMGAIGGHGSSRGITAGRGRSPQNWAILLGHRSFEIAIFLLDRGIDSGGVIDHRVFELTDRDDIRSSYFKASRLTAEMIIENIRNGRIRAREVVPQEGLATYLPQRHPGDGAIDWTRSTREVDRFVRALTRPYPGAFSGEGTEKLTIWRGRPFDATQRGAPGTVLTRFHSGELLISTGDGSYLVDEYHYDGLALDRGYILHSVNFAEQMRSVIERHQVRYLDLPLAPDILELIADE